MEKQKKHNGIISFWKFMVCMLILNFHFTGITTRKEAALFEFGSIGVEFFFLVSGYLMTKKAMKGECDTKNLGKETIQFVWKKFKGFFPYILIAFIATFIIRSCIAPYSINRMVNSIWDLFLIRMGGLKTTIMVGQTWYISAMFISMLILYPLIRKYKKNYIYLIAPLIIILLGGWLSHTYGNLRGPETWNGFVYKGLLRAFFELAIGSMIYELVEKIKNINFTKLGRILLTIIEIGGFCYLFIISSIGNSAKYDFITVLILSISIAIAFSEKTIFFNFANNKLFYYLEKLSLPIYLNHIWIILLTNETLNYLNYWQQLGIVIIVTIVFSMLVTKLIECVKKHGDKGKNFLKSLIIGGEKNQEV